MSDGNTFVLLLRMALSLALVLGLLVFVARWVSRRQGLLTGRTHLQVPVTVLNRQPLTRNAHLHVVQVGSDVLVLGVTDGQVNLLGSLDPADPALSQDSASTGTVAVAGQPGQSGRLGGAESSGPQDRSFFSSALGRVSAAAALGNGGAWQNQWRAPAQGPDPDSRRGRHRG